MNLLFRYPMFTCKRIILKGEQIVKQVKLINNWKRRILKSGMTIEWWFLIGFCGDIIGSEMIPRYPLKMHFVLWVMEHG